MRRFRGTVRGELTVEVAVAATASGRVVGERIAEGFRFLGVPYAAPPVGALRFRAPLPRDPWAEDLACLERRGDGEDALYLNLWTPELDGSGRPVLLWTSVPRNYDGRRFARDGAVLVTASTRGVPFASLCVEGLAEEGSANLVVLDQVAVLRWIAENVAAFGGDPGNVTVFGASHGGRSASALMVAPSSRGLVRRAAVMSMPRSEVMGRTEAHEVGTRMLEQLGVAPGHLEDLGDLPAASVAAAAEAVVGADDLTRLTFAVDGVVLADDPPALVAVGEAAGVDLLTGYTADEARYQLPASALPGRDRRSDGALIERDVRSWFDPSGVSLETVLETYRQSRRGESHLELLLAVSTDHFRVAAHRLALSQRAHAANVFAYRFAWPSPREGGRFGAYHYLDTHFAFDLVDEETTFAPLGRAAVVGDEPPLAVAAAYHGAFVRFATSGDPNGGGLPPWPPYEDATRPMMNFDERCAVLIDFERPLMDLWERARL